MGPGMARLDHLAIRAPTLEAGVAFVEAALGVPLAAGGAHPAMGTHNRLLSLGPGEYLEVIAVDPAARRPARRRWFGLDRPPGRPELCAWVVGVADLSAALSRAPAGCGAPMALSRGDLRWRMAVPESALDSALEQGPWDGLFPALTEWEGVLHPAARLPDHGLRLTALQLVHPDAAGLRAALAEVIDDVRVSVAAGSAPGIRACVQTPTGERWL